MSRVRIFELVRDDHDQPCWQPVATVDHPGRLEVVVTAWLHDTDPPPGIYRARSPDGRSLELHHSRLTGARS